MAKKRKKLSKAGKIILDIILVIAICVAGYSSYQLYIGWNEYHQSQIAYGDLKKEAEEAVTVEPEPEAEPSEFDPINYAYLKELNPDFGGWIKLPDSRIDYPFVYATDNEYYLYHLFNGEYNRSGCVFVDEDNQKEFQDKATILYAHHMRNGSMFADVENYKDPSYYETHKTFYISTENGRYEMYPVAGFVTSGSVGYVRITFENDEDFMSYVNSFIEKSNFQSDVTVNPEDQVVLLSTCSYDIYDGRYVLMGKLVKVK